MYYIIFIESRSLLGEILVSVKTTILFNVIARKNCHTTLAYSTSYAQYDNRHVVNRTSDNANLVQNLSSFVWLVFLCVSDSVCVSVVMLCCALQICADVAC